MSGGYSTAFAVGMAPTLAIIASYLLARRDSRKAAQKVAGEVATVATTVAETAHTADAKLDGIHVLVNSRLSEALDRITDLETRLIQAGESVPPTLPTHAEAAQKPPEAAG